MSDCHGACLPHCYCSGTTAVLAYAAFAWIVAAVIFLIVTRWVETPFCDSLTAEQKKMLEDSCRTRTFVFCAALLVAIIGLAATRPIRFACAE